ncbi:Uma2 family endonuclease [Actinomycetes bacterium KLBMP 9797]
MSAEPIPHRPGLWQPDPVRQRLAAYTIEDVWNLPDDAPRVELVDGVIHVVPSPTIDHQDITFLLCQWLREHAPRELRATMAIGIAIDGKNSREPDVVLYRAGVSTSNHYLTPDDVVVAVEVVSPGTRRRDRFGKPGEYAAVGIPYYWRVEQDPVHVFAYKLGDNQQYALCGDGAELLELTEPFAIKLPITEITP